MEAFEARLAALEKKVSALADRQEIENLVAKHNFYFSAGQGDKIVPELWSKDESASIEYGASGVYRAEKDSWKLKTYYVSNPIAGRFATFTAANSFIKVAEDGMSAKASYMVVGTETDAGDLATVKPQENEERRILLSSKTEDGKEYRAEVLFQKHAYNFVKEDGVWKIHDLHISEYFRCPAGTDWVSFAKERQITDGMWLEDMFESLDEIYPRWGTMRAENHPSAPTTYHWQYDVDALCEQQLDLED